MLDHFEDSIIEILKGTRLKTERTTRDSNIPNKCCCGDQWEDHNGNKRKLIDSEIFRK